MGMITLGCQSRTKIVKRDTSIGVLRKNVSSSSTLGLNIGDKDEKQGKKPESGVENCQAKCIFLKIAKGALVVGPSHKWKSTC